MTELTKLTSSRRKGKPSERVGRKALGLRIVFSNEFLVFSFPKHYKLTTKHYYGGWVAEVGQLQSSLNNSPVTNSLPYKVEGMCPPKG